jgi:Tfp pilus assembly protein PilO
MSMPFMYGFFKKKASESGLVLKDESFASEKESNYGSGLKEQRFNLEVFGSYLAFKNFLSALEKSARIIEVESVSFSSPKEGESILPFSLSVKFHSF